MALAPDVGTQVLDNADHPVQVEQRTVGEFYARPPLAQEDPKASKDVLAFGSILTTFLETYRQHCESLREQQRNEHFTTAFLRDQRRSEARVEIFPDRDGRTSTASPDAHAPLGLTYGLASQCNGRVTSFLRKNLFDQFKRPFAVLPLGKHDSNKNRVRIAISVIDNALKQARFKMRGPIMMQNIPTYGTSVWRYRERLQRRFVPDATGQFSEQIVDRVPELSIWSLMDVTWTDPEMPLAEDQEGVFWYHQAVGMSDLEAREAVRNPKDGSLVGGDLRNLEALREFGDDGTVTDIQHGRTDSKGAVTPRRPMTMVEYEGALPVEKWIKDGALTPAIAAWFMIRVPGWPEKGQGEDGYDVSSKEQWARQMGQISMWNVAYVDPNGNNGTNALGTQVLLRFEPERSHNPQNSLFLARYRSRGMKSYGQSVAETGAPLEMEVDSLHNDLFRNVKMNLDPPLVTDSVVAKSKTADELVKWWNTPGSAGIPLTPKQGMGASNARDAVVPVQRQYDAQNAWMVLNNAATNYRLLVGASSSAMSGSPMKTKTFSEMNVSEQISQEFLTEMARDGGVELARMFESMYANWYYSRTEEERVEHASRLSGLSASECQAALKTIDGIENDVMIVHPMMSGIDPGVAMSALTQAKAAFPGIFDEPKLAEMIAGFVVPNAEDLILENTLMSPDDEHMQMSAGQEVNPQVKEDSVSHLQQHLARGMKAGQEAQQASAQNQPVPEHLMNLIGTPEAQFQDGLLPRHIMQTEAMIQAKKEQAALMGAEQPKGAVPQKKQEGPSEPPRPGQHPQSSNEVASDVQGQSAGTPTGGQQ